MYQASYSHHRPRRSGSYFLPFLSIIILGLIVVLVFQIVDYFHEKSVKALENKASVSIVDGRAEMKVWGVDQWNTALDAGILNEGDAIRTLPGSRVVLTLLNGSVIRLNSETEIELIDLKTKDSQDELALTLKRGDVWIKRSEKDSVRASFTVATTHLEVNSLGTIFNVSQDTRESVRVLDGKVQVLIKVPDDSNANTMRTADTVQVALGQEVSVGAQEITDLQNRKPIELLALLSDSFHDTEWYKWNRSEDTTGAAGVTVADAVDKQMADRNALPPTAPATPVALELPPVAVSSATSAPAAITPALSTVDTSVPLTAPVILTPAAADRTFKTSSMTVTGTVARSTAQVEVTTNIGGRPSPYVLRKYQPGSTNWSYVVSANYQNLVPGENSYVFTAISKDGVRSDATTLVLTYDKPVEPADLSAPNVVSFNGG
ncbi:MAG: hypothetical protein UY05_C0025G0006, partial [Candidatus Peregrinibacteria bacterium GW2011_GWA2_47_7]